MNADGAGQVRPWQVHLLMLVTASLVATSFTVGKAIAADLDPMVLTLLRFLCGGLLFLPWARHPGRPVVPPLPALLRYSLISLSLTGFFVLMFLALRSTSALNTGVIFTLVPGISGIYAMVLLRERLGRARLTALVLAMVGAVWVLFHGNPQRLLAMELNRGDLIFFAGCLLMALYTPLVKLFHRGEPMTEMTFWILVTGGLWLLPVALPGLTATDWTRVPARAWLGILYLAVFCTIVSFFLTQWATMYLGPTRVMAYSYLYPPLILVIDWAMGHGLPPAASLPGILVITLAMIVVQRIPVSSGPTRSGQQSFTDD